MRYNVTNGFRSFGEIALNDKGIWVYTYNGQVRYKNKELFLVKGYACNERGCYLEKIF